MLGVRRLRDPDRGRPRGRALGRLADDDPRRCAGLGEAGRDRRDVPAAAERQRDDVRRGLEPLEQLEDDTLLPFDRGPG